MHFAFWRCESDFFEFWNHAAAAEEAAQKLLGATLVTPQTGPKGKKVERLYVEQGLAIARSVIDRHGGKIVVDSEVGRGSTFTIELPSNRRARGLAA